MSAISLALPRALGQVSHTRPDFSQAPAGFVPPPLHPRGVELQTQRLADGVYALMSTRPPVDNSGFVVGERGVLVIDSHINAAMARQIQAAVREVTEKPILFLVNTNYHGDHTFGNDAFPAETLIVAHENTAQGMRDFAGEKAFLLAAVENDASVFGDANLRLPDVVFDDTLRIDLGGKLVELHHFGRGNTTGDTVVYVPSAHAAWTGNLVVGGIVPPIFEGGTREYLATISRFAQTLDVHTIVPGHGPLSDRSALSGYMTYLNELIGSVRGSISAGRDAAQTVEALPLDDKYLPPPSPATAALVPVIRGFHRLNVQVTYNDLRTLIGSWNRDAAEDRMGHSRRLRLPLPASQTMSPIVFALLLAGAPQNALSSLERDSGWELLFDGETTRGWRSYGQPGFPEQGWNVMDGCLHHEPRGGGGDIVFERPFADFELEFEWKVVAGANSGVKVRVPELGSEAGMVAPEYQILDDAAHTDAQPNTRTAALYAIKAAEGAVPSPVGEFNRSRIVARGSRFEHWLNGVRVLAIDAASDEWEARRGGQQVRDDARLRSGRARLDRLAGPWRRGLVPLDQDAGPVQPAGGASRAGERYQSRRLEGARRRAVDQRRRIDPGRSRGGAARASW